MRGRDIKRYSYDWAGLWLVATFPSKHYDIEKYPAVKNYLLSFDKRVLAQTGEKKIDGDPQKNARKRTNNKWFETQDSIGYWEDFFKPKICWKAVGRNLTFAIVEAGTFLTAPASFISAGKFNDYILAYLCSSVAKYFIYKYSDTTGAGDIMLNIQSLVKLPVPVPQKPTIFSYTSQEYIDDIVYKSYDLSIEEIEYIKSNI